MVEQRLTVVGYEGSYEVSNCGRVRSLDRLVHGRWGERPRAGIMLKQALTSNGYRHIGLSAGGKDSRRGVHTLVLEAFVGPVPVTPERYTPAMQIGIGKIIPCQTCDGIPRRRIVMTRRSMDHYQGRTRGFQSSDRGRSRRDKATPGVRRNIEAGNCTPVQCESEDH